MTSKTTHVSKAAVPAGRLYTGGAIFIAGFFSPVLVPLVANSTLSVEWKTIISGLLVFGIPELAMLLAVAVMGKDGFSYLKGLLFRLLGKHFTPPDTVSRTRYRIGLVLFTLPLLLGWITPYLSGHTDIFENYRLHFAISGDVLLFCSLFILGGDFWDKLRAIFIWQSKEISNDV